MFSVSSSYILHEEQPGTLVFYVWVYYNEVYCQCYRVLVYDLEPIKAKFAAESYALEQASTAGGFAGGFVQELVNSYV